MELTTGAYRRTKIPYDEKNKEEREHAGKTMKAEGKQVLSKNKANGSLSLEVHD